VILSRRRDFAAGPLLGDPNVFGRPGGSPPQKDIGAATRPMNSHNIRGRQTSGTNPGLARVAGNPLSEHRGQRQGIPFDLGGFSPLNDQGLPVAVVTLCEAARHIEWLSLLQHVERGTHELVSQGLACEYRIRPGFLALLELPGIGAKLHGEVGRFNECPAQVRVYVPGIAFALLLAIAYTPAVHAPRVGGVVTCAGEAFNGPDFQQDHCSRCLTNVGHRGQESVVGTWRDFFMKTLFHDGDL
jgi:hypothetical protein